MHKPQTYDTQATTVRLPRELLKRVRIYAAEHDTSIQQLIIDGLYSRLADKGVGKKERK